jgi:hypothetical protein
MKKNVINNQFLKGDVISKRTGYIFWNIPLWDMV